MKPPEFSVYASCKYEHNGREYHIHVDERGEATVDIFLTSEDRQQAVIASHESLRDVLAFFTFDISETWTGIIDDTIARLRKVIAP